MLKFKNIIAILLCIALACSMTACGEKKEENNNDVNQESTPTIEGEVTEEVVDESKDMGEIKELLGYDVTFPEELKDATQTNYARETEIQVDISSEEGELLRRIVKAKAEPDAEAYGFPYKKDVAKNSIAYTLYTFVTSEELEEGQEMEYGMVTWSDGEYYYLYSVALSIPESEMIAICEKIK